MSLTRIIFFVIVISFSSANAGMDSMYNFEAIDINNKKISFKTYQGKVLLIVNTASGCGYTPQFKGMQDLYKKFKHKGLEVLAFPSNDFKQEPLGRKSLQKFCQSKYKITFPLFNKISVKGNKAHPLYKFLIKNSNLPQVDVRWNFEKFLVSKKGKVLKRYESATTPEDKTLYMDIVKALDEK